MQPLKVNYSNTEIFISDYFIDDSSLQKQLRQTYKQAFKEVKFNKLVELAEKSPVLINDALNNLQGQLNGFNWRIDNNVNTSLNHLTEERKKLIEFY